MSTRRHHIVGLCTALLLAALHTGLGAQETYPSRPLRIVVPSGPGSAPDLIARLLGERLTAKWGQPAVVEHKPGAGGNLGAEFVFKAPPDGHTLLSTWSSPLVVNQSLYARLNFDPGAFVVVAVIATSPNLLVVHPKVPVATLAELVAHAKANPDKLTYASVGIGGTPHLAMEMLKSAAGVQIRRIPYNRGLAPAITDTLAGQVDMVFGNLADVRPHIQSGALRPIAVGSSARVPELPDIPAIAESYPGYLNVAWYAFVAPPKTPADIAAKLTDAIHEAQRQPEVAKRMRGVGLTPVTLSSAETAAFIASDTARWRKVIDDAGIKAE